MALACKEEPGDWSDAAADDVIVSPPAFLFLSTTVDDLLQLVRQRVRRMPAEDCVDI